MIHQSELAELSRKIKGDVYTDDIQRIIYSTDASVYKEKPILVSRPVDTEDIKALIEFARKTKTSLIPRTAGTSLAGQVVGGGIVVDVSKYFTKIIEINKKESWVRVQPGVVLDELNQVLEPYGLFFGPETSTANRCMIGGMVGNNACGLHSIIYGSTRDHTLAVKGILSDGSEAEFSDLKLEEFLHKCKLDNLEGKIYISLYNMLRNKNIQHEIIKEFPDPALARRNNGYAVDLLIDSDPFLSNGKNINLSKIIAGSEGTLVFITEIKLNLVPLPPPHKALLCAQFESINESLKANLVALKYKPGAIELMDKTILDCTKSSIEHQQNRFFIKDDPAAVLMIEFARESEEETDRLCRSLINDMKKSGLGYFFSVVKGKDIQRVWNLRKAGLGVLANIPGDKKSVPVIEDTAVKVDVLPEYIDKIDRLFEKYCFDGVYYAHVGSGEIHLRPILDLKKEEDVIKFKELALETAILVKSFRGSMSGEHGDGRLRANLIPVIIGEKNYQLIKEIKRIFDPDNIFNQGKITDAPEMDTNLRFSKNQQTKDIQTIFDFSSSMGFMRAIEKCNGSGDCRKSVHIGGTMCPSYMASKDESNTTRARANLLREIITESEKENPFDHKELYKILDLCLSCKACKSECPSGVDMAKIKAEFLQHYYDCNGIPLRSRLIANISRLYAIGALFPGLTNFFLANTVISSLFKKILGFSPSRKIPLLHKTTLHSWIGKNIPDFKAQNNKGKILFYIDEFTNFNDTDLGIKALSFLSKLGYEIIIPASLESGRTYISKGLIRKAKILVDRNIKILKDLVGSETPLIGLEPSAILTFRDEYPELADKENVKDSLEIAKHTYMIDEFLNMEMLSGKISEEIFTSDKKEILFHGHCQQKSIASTDPTKYILSFPKNYSANEIPSGCCGMAGAFGYENEHYDLSMKVGELVLFPEIRKCSEDIILAAPGTSCRQHIKDGTGCIAKHPVEILFDALKE